MANSGNRLNPCCPNHGCELERTGLPGLGKCPISSCLFRYDDSEQGMMTVIGTDGQLYSMPMTTPVEGSEKEESI